MSASALGRFGQKPVGVVALAGFVYDVARKPHQLQGRLTWNDNDLPV